MSVWKSLTPAQQRLLVRRWNAFSPLSVEQANLDDTASALKVGTYIDRSALYRDLDAARLAYVQALLVVGILKPDQPVPGDDFLWEMHPMNIEGEPPY